MNEITICLISSHLIKSSLFTDIKSCPKKMLLTPFIDSIFLTNSFLKSFLLVISFINDFYADGKEFVIDENDQQDKTSLSEIEEKIVKILDQKIRPAVAKDGGDIKFKEFKDGVVKVQLQGSCSGCPSATMTLKQGVQNLLCHYLPEVKEVEAI